MPKAQPLTPGAGATVVRLWWVVVLAALIGGAVAYAAADRSTTDRIYGVVNIRPVATVANDRVDLVEDLDAALTLPSVLQGPAEEADMSVSELRQDLTVQPLGETSFVRVGVIVHDGDEAAAEEVLRAVVASAATFMSGENSGAVADDALETQLQFATQREAALEVALASTPENSPAREGLEVEREAARQHRQRVEERVAAQEEARAANRVVLPLTMQGADLTSGGSDTQVRRAAAGAAVGALVAVVVVAGLSLLGRRRTP
ncbi:hypothetical protein [Nocardioides bizhenqiangii]|uniref:Polysaccharide chain length determinant N-terminal domain-containing protein n=1 Tax=Nocardioides bizhenqiangii TaxID=3095076 RepID=A0ABZ0ZQ83_9ACTN|nr:MULTISPECIES: hypothetical protein [unclassified Nocardioides]MDZ5621535.1 hypothetical protein [Nocardioides sp. HM23]WQQ25628.1 hypothetical protein SHK19_16875 [Nocardioides sp. HM61]